MEYNWRVQSKKADFNAIAQQFQIDPVIARVIRNRDIIGKDQIQDFLYPDQMKDYDPWLFKDMEKAVSIMEKKIKEKKRIRIIADYDADGVTSNFILYKGLMKIGAEVSYRIPDRMTDGYGVNQRFIEEALDDQIDTIITCDNGISAIEQVKLAKENGITFIITDHHSLPYDEDENGNKKTKMPEADAIVNPHREDCDYPYEDICGAVVAFHFIEALYERMGIDKSETYEFHEFIAIGTVCDVMPLKDENRKNVKRGLDKLRYTKNVGLAALLSVNDLLDKPLSAYHLGFVIGPCINATGRLYHAKMAMDLLLCTDFEEAKAMALELKKINDERKMMTERAMEDAIRYVEDYQLVEDKVFVVYLPDCHESLAGIVAGRIRERYYRPTLVITDASEEGMVKGSARSTPEYHMYQGLHECRELLKVYGGHPQAAGFSLKKENLELFRQMLNANCKLKEEDMIPKLMIDVPMPIGYVSERVVEELSLLEPCGKDNEKPLFAEADLMVLNGRLIGKESNHLKLTLVSKDGYRQDAIMFHAQATIDKMIERFGREAYDNFMSGKANDILVDVAYYPDINEFRGIKNIQIKIQQMRMK